MKEYDNVKEAMKDLISTTEEVASYDYQLEFICDKVYGLADLLGMSELYKQSTKIRTIKE